MPPTIILVPGAFFPSDVYGEIIPALEAAGHACVSIKLASVGADPPLPDLSEDVRAVHDALQSVVGEEGKECVVVMHSFGGVPGSEAVAGFGRAERAKAGLPGGVVRLVYLASFVVPSGKSLYDAAGRTPPYFWDVQGEAIHAMDPEHVFFNDLPPEVGKRWAARLTHHSFGSLDSPRTTKGWQGIPAIYLLCEKDNAIPAEAQEGMVAAAIADGGDFEIRRCDAGHMPQLARPEMVVDLIREAAASGAGKR